MKRNFQTTNHIFKWPSRCMIAIGLFFLWTAYAPDLLWAQQIDCQDSQVEVDRKALLSSGGCGTDVGKFYSPLANSNQNQLPLSPLTTTVSGRTIYMPFGVISGMPNSDQMITLLEKPNLSATSAVWVGAALLIVTLLITWGNQMRRGRLLNQWQENCIREKEVFKNRIATLNEESSHRFRLITSLNTELSEKRSEIAAKNKQVTELENRVGDLEQQIADWQNRAADLEQQIEQVRKENILKLFQTEQDQLTALFNGFLETRSKFEDVHTAMLERLMSAEDHLDSLQLVIKALQGIAAEIQQDEDGQLYIKTPIPDDQYEFFGVGPTEKGSVEKTKVMRGKLLRQFHPDKAHALHLEWVTQLFTRLTEEINTRYDQLSNHSA